MLSKFIYQLGVFFRNKKINLHYASLLKSQYYDLAELERDQLIKLKKLLHWAVQNSKYYKDSFEEADIDLKNINSLADIKLLPTVTKKDLLNNVDLIQVPVPGEKSYYSETSGSTGEPLVFYRNQDWDAWHNASVFRGYSWHDVKPWDRNGYLWGYNYSWAKSLTVRVQDKLQNRFRLFNYDEDELIRFCKKLSKAKYLNGYSSMIYELSKRINKNDSLKKNINLKLIKGTSEKIYDSYQQSVVEAFGLKMISEYGAAEAGIIAFECGHGNMHVNMETCIVEEVEGKIVVTNLTSKSFPIIRYELGDYIVLDVDNKCGCGMSSHIIKEVTGRVGKNIYGKNGIYPSLTLYYIFKNIAIKYEVHLNYHVIQKEKGKVDFLFESTLSEAEKKYISVEIDKYFGSDITYTLYEEQSLINRDGKKTDFISEL